MKAGLVGYAQSGKTTLFNALTGLHKGGAAARGQVNLGAIKVPDPRVEALAAIFKPRKTSWAEMLFVGRAWGALPRVQGSRPNRCGRWRKWTLSASWFADFLRSTERRRAWRGELNDFDAELLLHDLGIVEKRLDRLRKEHGKTSGEFHELERLHGQLDAGKPLRTMRWSDAEEKEMAHFGFLSRRPLLVVVNAPEESAASAPPAEVEAAAGERGAEAISLCAPVEVGDLGAGSFRAARLPAGDGPHRARPRPLHPRRLQAARLDQLLHGR